MTTAWSAVYDYLDGRGAAYGITTEELIAKTPSIIQDDPHAVLSFWQQKDISHILPTSTHPELAGDFSNWIPEDPGPNHARQDYLMSWADHNHAQLDNILDALWSI
ncbi:hypothetical protein [Synechococcus sp. CCAP 1479/9]|uniref:hypothetical protein n=1 Tax=Synechococcus sp. CCAP 1479/9 TaxID=1221593 RepID=UPI001C247600|nr:hypothetical protein [Synechococcus sp. CCAP 1479/9]